MKNNNTFTVRISDSARNILHTYKRIRRHANMSDALEELASYVLAASDKRQIRERELTQQLYAINEELSIIRKMIDESVKLPTLRDVEVVTIQEEQASGLIAPAPEPAIEPEEEELTGKDFFADFQSKINS